MKKTIVTALIATSFIPFFSFAEETSVVTPDPTPVVEPTPEEIAAQQEADRVQAEKDKAHAVFMMGGLVNPAIFVDAMPEQKLVKAQKQLIETLTRLMLDLQRQVWAKNGVVVK